MESESFSIFLSFSGVLNDKHIQNLARKITNKADLRELGVSVLGLEFEEVDSIYTDSKGINEAASKLLQIWRKNQTSSSQPYTLLCSNLRDNGWSQMAHELDHLKLAPDHTSTRNIDLKNYFPSGRNCLLLCVLLCAMLCPLLTNIGWSQMVCHLKNLGKLTSGGSDLSCQSKLRFSKHLLFGKNVANTKALLSVFIHKLFAHQQD